VIVLGSASGITRFTGKNVTDPLKLFFGQFLSFGHPSRLPYSPFSYNLECRLALVEWPLRNREEIPVQLFITREVGLLRIHGLGVGVIDDR